MAQDLNCQVPAPNITKYPHMAHPPCRSSPLPFYNTLTLSRNIFYWILAGLVSLGLKNEGLVRKYYNFCFYSRSQGCTIHPRSLSALASSSAGVGGWSPRGAWAPGDYAPGYCAPVKLWLLFLSICHSVVSMGASRDAQICLDCQTHSSLLPPWSLSEATHVGEGQLPLPVWLTPLLACRPSGMKIPK